MADIAVGLAIQLLKSLIEEAYLVSGLPNEITTIDKELNIILAFLKSAEERAEENSGVKEWVKQVRILAYNIEDVIEEYQLSHKKGRWDNVMQICMLHSRSRVKRLRERASELGKQKDSYGLNVVGPGQCSYKDAQLTISSMCIAEEFKLVGTEKPKTDIIDKMGLNKLDSRTSTLTVVGKRGLGKTTVVGSVYKDTIVSEYFPFRAWVGVSQYGNTLDMFKSIAKQLYDTGREALERYKEAGMVGLGPIAPGREALERYKEAGMVGLGPIAPGEVDCLDEDSLICRVQKFLQEKRYMVVFDDVEDIKVRELVRALPSNDKGSKILITTRSKNVSREFDAEYEVEPLPLDMAWELFCKKTFQSDGGKCPGWLEARAREVLNKCEGVPLIILAIGRLLSTKPNDVSVWEKVCHGLGHCLESPELMGIHKILIRSYYELPHSLKPCFLYFGLFPKDYHVDKMRLIRLWIAEGLIKEKRDLTPEQVAEENLNELLSLSMVEVVSKDSSEEPKTLRVHEFLHEIILSKLQELSFCQVLSTKYSDTDAIEDPRRLSIHNGDSDKACKALESISRCKSKSNIRCLLIDPAVQILPKVLNKEFIRSVHLLKVLELRNALITDIPKVVGELLNLRYLGLRNTGVEKLPSSIGKLEYLQTLDLKGTHIHKLPTEINRLHKLRHLLTYSYNYSFAINRHMSMPRGVDVPEGALGGFVELQKLAFIDVSHKTGVMHELENLTQLRKLGIMGLKTEDGGHLCGAITLMESLQTFSVYSENKSEIDLERLKCPPLTLKRLFLNGLLKSFPRWILDIHSLVKIRLRWSRLLRNSEPLQNLGKLPNLVELQLLEAYDDDTLHIEYLGFQKLKILNLLDLRNLRRLRIDEGAFPLLEELSIGESPHLEVPSGIECLTRLKLLNFFGMSQRFIDCLCCSEQYASIVKHVPEPHILFQQEHNGAWVTYFL